MSARRAIINRFEDLDLNRRYSYADYSTWRFAERVELLRGWVVPIRMAPMLVYQRIRGRLSAPISLITLEANVNGSTRLLLMFFCRKLRAMNRSSSQTLACFVTLQS